MRMNPLFNNAKQQALIAAVVALLPLGSAQATDLYDSLKAWENQAGDAKKYRDSQQTAPPSMQSEQADSNASGAQGPIRSDVIEDRPATEPAAPQVEEPHP